MADDILWEGRWGDLRRTRWQSDVHPNEQVCVVRATQPVPGPRWARAALSLQDPLVPFPPPRSRLPRDPHRPRRDPLDVAAVGSSDLGGQCDADAGALVRIEDGLAAAP